MSLPRVVAVASESPAERAGLVVGDELLSINGRSPRDVIEYRLLVDEPSPELVVSRGGLEVTLVAPKEAGEPLGIEVHSAVFDRIRTCDNHCEFCFIFQLPKGMRKSLYVKDDDYRLSFLYGNFTTLTRFTEADLERVITEGLSPLFVSIHATDPEVRAQMLRNRRGATSLRWLRALLDNGIEVHGQVVVCPGVNDGAVLEDTLVGVLDRFSDLATLCVVPLGVSRFNAEGSMRPHTLAEAETVVDTVERWQSTFLDVLGRRLVFAADEYYLLTDRSFPAVESYEGFPQHENGVGIARTFEAEFLGATDLAGGVKPGFFAWVEGAPAEGYRGPRATPTAGRGPATILTGSYGARLLAPLVGERARVVAVDNEFFGGNIGVAGLLTGADLTRALSSLPEDGRYLIPDVCLSNGAFLDGLTVDDLPRAVEVVKTDGHALREALAA